MHGRPKDRRHKEVAKAGSFYILLDKKHLFVKIWHNKGVWAWGGKLTKR